MMAAMTTRLLRPPLVAAAGIAFAGAAVFQAGPGVTGLGPVRRAMFPGLLGTGHDDHVALTFDDGPDQAATPGFIEALARHRVKATFFLLGSKVAQNPRLAAELVAAGHEVAVHGWEHRFLPLRGPLAIHDDLARAADTIGEVTGAVPRLFRPPYGVLSTGALLAARRLRLATVLWSCWGKEWMPGSTGRSVYAELSGDLRGGATVLLHDSDATSPAGSAKAALDALDPLFDECARQGLRVGPLGEHGLRQLGQ
jgi:peptidoglycan/xylan/chitin deacetylase (PgdA/CDA1 family)